MYGSISLWFAFPLWQINWAPCQVLIGTYTSFVKYLFKYSGHFYWASVFLLTSYRSLKIYISQILVPCQMYVCKYFLMICGLPLNFPNDVFWWVEVFILRKFDLLCSLPNSVLVFQGCRTTYPKLGGLNKRRLLSRLLVVRCPKLRCGRVDSFWSCENLSQASLLASGVCWPSFHPWLVEMSPGSLTSSSHGLLPVWVSLSKFPLL